MSDRPDRLILVYNGESGLFAMLLDVVKKSMGREECALCEITYGPLGKRDAWKSCQRSLGMIVDELHRDEIPGDWKVDELPCILARVRDEKPFVLVSRAQIESCKGRVDRLEAEIQAALERHVSRDAGGPRLDGRAQ